MSRSSGCPLSFGPTPARHCGPKATTSSKRGSRGSIPSPGKWVCRSSCRPSPRNHILTLPSRGSSSLRNTAREMRCATRTTPQAKGCITQSGPPRISAAALLQLAPWCQARHSESLGGPPCSASTAPQFPPAPAASDKSQAAEPALVGPAHFEASGACTGPQPDHRQEPPARDAEGGRL